MFVTYGKCFRVQQCKEHFCCTKQTFYRFRWRGRGGILSSCLFFFIHSLFRCTRYDISLDCMWLLSTYTRYVSYRILLAQMLNITYVGMLWELLHLFLPVDWNFPRNAAGKSWRNSMLCAVHTKRLEVFKWKSS